MPRIQKRDHVKRVDDIARRGKVVGLVEHATKARVKWDHGMPKYTLEPVSRLRRIGRKGHGKSGKA